MRADHLLHPGDRRCREVAEEVVRAERPAEGEAQDQGAHAVARRSGRAGPCARSAVGESANTAWTVALNWRTLGEPGGEGHLGHREGGGLDEHPGRLRTLGPGQGDRSGTDLGQQQALELAHPVAELCGEPGTPARSTSPSAMSRMARATTSARRSHSGDPGVAPGRHRLQARKPARWAAAAVAKKRTWARCGVRAGQLGRQ